LKKKLHQHTWGNRKQVFRWVNGIDYGFESNDKKRQILHVVECQESWNEVDRESGKTEEKNSRHVWLSSEPLNKFNLQERCNLAARSRWCIESCILVEKHHGYVCPDWFENAKTGSGLDSCPGLSVDLVMISSFGGHDFSYLRIDLEGY
jgi:hypothetical protein